MSCICGRLCSFGIISVYSISACIRAKHAASANGGISRKFFSREFGIELPGESQPFFHTQKDNLRVRIEKHSEFFSITLIFDNVVRKGRNLNGLFVADGADLVPAALLRNAPSPVLVATWVETIDDERELQPSDIATMFGHDNFAAARVGDGRAKVYHSFKLDNHPYMEGGFIRILVQNESLGSRRLGRWYSGLLRSSSIVILPCSHCRWCVRFQGS